MASSDLRRELLEFQAAVQKLSDGVGRASSIWRDEKYAELSGSVAQVAAQARDFMMLGDQLCNEIDRFDRIAAEKY